jgi:hypothetical protein
VPNRVRVYVYKCMYVCMLYMNLLRLVFKQRVESLKFVNEQQKQMK